MKNYIESEIRRTVLLAHEHKGGFLLLKILLNLFPGKMLVKLDIARLFVALLCGVLMHCAVCPTVE